MTKGVESLVCTDWIRHKFTKSRIPDNVRARILCSNVTIFLNMLFLKVSCNVENFYIKSFVDVHSSGKFRTEKDLCK